jgi:Fe-S cluster biogenesis protein NfuA/nitrite reductase/ring-hydroxylating ferredoxin subunit
MDNQEIQERVGRVEALLNELEALPDPAARSTGIEAVQVLLDIYGEGLARVMKVIARQGSQAMAEAVAEDELISHLLLLHGLHPVDVESRVRQALQEVRPYLKSHGGNVELLAVAGGIARLRFQGSCSGCPSSMLTFRLAIEQAVQQAAPELERVEAENLNGASGPGSFVPVDSIRGQKPSQAAPGSWVTASPLPQVSGGEPSVKEVAGIRVLFLKLDEDYYAYQADCPGCATSLERGELDGRTLACAGCSRRYDARRAGKCLDAADLHLEPIPLLRDDQGAVKIALLGGAGN